MSQGLSLVPVYLVDFGGACLMLLLSCTAFFYARRFKLAAPDSVLASYLFWLCSTLVFLSVSRAGGHLVKIFLFLEGKNEAWEHLAPVTGSLNTLAFAAVAVLTFYFPNVGGILARIKRDARKLRCANARLRKVQAALQALNQTLEHRVEQRTRELKASEEKFRNLFESSRDMIFFCDHDGTISDINNSGVQLLGCSTKEEILGRPLRSFFRDEEWEKYYETLCSEGFVADFEARWHRADGSYAWVIISANRIEGDGSKCGGCEGIVKDITALKEMMEKLVYSEKMASVGQMAAGVAHEINNPLGVILGYADLLAEELEDPAAREDLDVIKRQALVCKRVVSDLLQFSRQEEGGKRESFDLNGLVRDTVAMVAHAMEMHKIFIELSLSREELLITGDRSRLGQVLVNLLNNARDAIGEDGLVMITSRRLHEEGVVELVVADNGEGIPQELQAKIFDPFFTTKPVGQGTGLGLAVSYGIVEDHGGSITVESPPLDQELLRQGMSTAFRLRFPGQEVPT